MQWLSWQDAGGMATASAVAWGATARPRRRWHPVVRGWAEELTLLLVLYAAWQYAGAWSIGRRAAAFGRGRWVWHAERLLHWPSERSLQQLVIHHHPLVYLLNLYYVGVHVPTLAVCLLWVFVRHRDNYPLVRTTVVFVTGISLAMQMLPVAPPRLLPSLGMVDAGKLVGPNVYAGGAPGIDQLSAMPSLHVGWALAVASAVVVVGSRRRRWLAFLYPLATTLDVVATGNHYWADAVIAVAVYMVAVAGAIAVHGCSWRVTPRPLVEARQLSQES